MCANLVLLGVALFGRFCEGFYLPKYSNIDSLKINPSIGDLCPTLLTIFQFGTNMCKNFFALFFAPTFDIVAAQLSKTTLIEGLQLK